MELTSGYLKSLLRYEPDTGNFYWIKHRKGANKKKPAGCISKAHGYRSICIDGIWHRAHRLAWFYMNGSWPDGEIDHADRVRGNNAWGNLRLATHQQNCINTNVRRTNKSGSTGVSWDDSRGKWLAQIRIDGKKKNLGRYLTKEQAIEAWVAAAQTSFPEFRGLSDNS